MGFIGPYSGTRHQFMVYNRFRLSVPSNDEYSIPQVKMLIKEIEKITGKPITIEDWNES
jgi:hypothetical protein